ncbi:MAG: HNH endonuclease, partial [Clostridia bacterium]|nr:HNH endonuclease [Clostridia bacterium]
STVRHRLGQGGFRVSVTDAYQRRCAIPGEKTLPVLEAAHIIPYSQDGHHTVSTGILFKSDFHTLFDDGYITLTQDYVVEVSRSLHEDYGNGKDYYKYHGQKLLILPENAAQRPDPQYIEWHNNNVYRG